MSINTSESSSSRVLAGRHPSSLSLVCVEAALSILFVYAVSKFKFIEPALKSFLSELSDERNSASLLSELVGLEVGVAALAVAFVGVNSLSWKDVSKMSAWRAEWEANRQHKIYVFMVSLGMLSAVIAILGGVESWQKDSKTSWAITALLFAIFVFVAALPSVMPDDGLNFLREYRVRLASLKRVDKFASRIDPQLQFRKEVSVVENRRTWIRDLDIVRTYFPYGWATLWVIVPLLASIVTQVQFSALSSVLWAAAMLGLSIGVSLGLSMKLISRRDGEVFSHFIKASAAYLLILMWSLRSMVDVINVLFSRIQEQVAILIAIGVLALVNIGVFLLFSNMPRLWRVKVFQKIFVVEADSVLHSARQGRRELELAQKEVDQEEGVRVEDVWSKRIEEDFMNSESVRSSAKVALRYFRLMGMAGDMGYGKMQFGGAAKSGESVRVGISVKVEGSRKIEVEVVKE